MANTILELKAETARQDIVTLRKAASLGNPLVMLAAKLRGLLDGVRLARRILSDNAEFPSDYGVEIDETAGDQFDYPAGRKSLCLPGGATETTDTGKICDISGKHRRR